MAPTELTVTEVIAPALFDTIVTEPPVPVCEPPPVTDVKFLVAVKVPAPVFKVPPISAEMSVTESAFFKNPVPNAPAANVITSPGKAPNPSFCCWSYCCYC